MFFSSVANSENSELAIGLSVGLVLLFVVIGIPVCLVIIACRINSKKRNPLIQTHIVTPATGTTVVINQGTSMCGQVGQSQYELQPMHKDAQLSYRDPPPSYAVSAAYPLEPSIPQVHV